MSWQSSVAVSTNDDARRAVAEMRERMQPIPLPSGAVTEALDWNARRDRLDEARARAFAMLLQAITIYATRDNHAEGTIGV